MLTSKRLSRLGSGVFDRNDQRKHSYKLGATQQHQPLIDLSLGCTDLLPPPAAVEAMANHLQEPRSAAYCLHAATASFREAAAAWCEQRLGVSVDPEREVLLLVGSQEGTAHFPLTVLDPGDQALILDPSYPSHRGGLELADAFIQTLPLSPEQGWAPNFKAITDSQWAQLRLLMLGFPHNPTACVGQQSWLDEAMGQAQRHDLVVAHDNPYLDLALEGEAPSLLRCPRWRERGIEFFSLSKGWCLGGFRLAFAIGAETLITALRQVKSVIDFNQCQALQQGAVVALSDHADWPAHLLPIYRERRDRTRAALSELGWPIPSPSMALYLWAPIPDWARAQGWGDEEMAAQLLKHCGVVVTPGSGFGEAGRDWLRFALVRPVAELEAAISRLTPWWQQQC
ncbi:aminotransferase class I/II-fold pyridoxal phosphate-dependent enzyme [Synechococcus sp. Cu2B8-bc1011]|uniref:aminotransferase class I/II-fold pyridoxal phosphate-dependent enzyme n=1 Tax=Synechococcus sp. Cu2B8-bc1011 TaxID=3093725 RepID=UPI0039B08840